MRFVDLQEYMPVLIEILETGKEVNLVVSGGSMIPFLVPRRDTIIISKPKEPFQRGDMVFFRRVNGEYIMHRIHHMDRQKRLYLVGDSQQKIEGPILQSQVFGIIKKVIRKNKLVDSTDITWKFFEKVWIRCVPIRPILIKMYKIIRRVF